ncbi:MAG: hypothetical protein LBU85_06860 [Treponema sp.]|jgi:hypothetical protein|nr:hypothetical protein [Treponema sp.]
MKKTFILLAVAFLAVGALPAQGWGGRGSPEPVKIEGTLQLHNGQFAVASGNNIYYVPRIGRYVGFIDSLKEGSNVSFEGYVFGNFLRPVTMTISGKSYDLAGGANSGANSGASSGTDGGARKKGEFNNRGFNRFGPAPGCCGSGYGGNDGNRPRGSRGRGMGW